MPDTDKDILERSLSAGVGQVELEFADIAGSVKSVSVPVRRLARSSNICPRRTNVTITADASK